MFARKSMGQLAMGHPPLKYTILTRGGGRISIFYSGAFSGLGLPSLCSDLAALYTTVTHTLILLGIIWGDKFVLKIQ